MLGALWSGIQWVFFVLFGIGVGLIAKFGHNPGTVLRESTDRNLLEGKVYTAQVKFILVWGAGAALIFVVARFLSGNLFPPGLFWLPLLLAGVFALAGWVYFQENIAGQDTVFPDLDTCTFESLESVRKLEAAKIFDIGKYVPPPNHWPPGDPGIYNFKTMMEGFFLGMGPFEKPVYIPTKTFKTQHMQIVGPTRVGKGVVLQSLAIQAIHAGHRVVVIDPKCDSYLLPALAHASKATTDPDPDDAGFFRAFHIVDLMREGYGGWHPFATKDDDDREKRLLKSCDVLPRGSDADHYRRAARPILAEMVREIKSGRLDDMIAWLENHPEGKKLGPLDDFRTWASRESLCPSGKGFDLEQALEKNEPVYVRGDTTNPAQRVPLQAFLSAVFQWRTKNRGGAHLTVFCDEMAFYANPDLADDLATVIESGVNVVLAYQDMSDLEAVVNSYGGDGRSVKQRINTNCQAKLFFGTQDDQSVDAIVKMSGTRVMEVETVTEGGAEKRTTKRQEERPRIPANLVRECPKGIMFYFQQSQVPKLVHTNPVPLPEGVEPVTDWKAAYELPFASVCNHSFEWIVEHSNDLLEINEPQYELTEYEDGSRTVIDEDEGMMFRLHPNGGRSLIELDLARTRGVNFSTPVSEKRGDRSPTGKRRRRRKKPGSDKSGSTSPDDLG